MISLRSKMFLCPRWDHLCSDSSWLFHVTAWLTEGRTIVPGKTIRIECDRRPDMNEILLVSADRTFVRSLLDPPNAFVARLQSLKLNANQHDEFIQSTTLKTCFDIRSSDLSLISDCPYAFCFRLMDDAIDADRPVSRAVQVTIFAENIIDILKEGEVIQVESFTNPTRRISARMFRENGLNIATMTIEPEDGPVDSRYNKVRQLKSCEYLVDLGVRTREIIGHEVITSLPVHQYEISSASAYAAGLLHFADIAWSVAWEHALPPDSPFYRTLAEEDGKRKFIGMYRAANCHVFGWPQVGTTLRCMSWIAKTGRSTFDLRVDFRENDARNGRPIASVQVTMVVVDRIKMKSSPVFHSKEWAEERYKSSIDRALPADFLQPEYVKDVTSEQATFVYEIGRLRHSDHDQNGHVNSAEYLDLVHDARNAALKGEFFPKSVARLVEREGWIRRFGVDYLAELKMAHINPHVKIQYYVLDQGTKAIVTFEFIASNQTCTKVWIETLAEFDSKKEYLSGQLTSGCVPEDWGVPSSLVQQSSL